VEEAYVKKEDEVILKTSSNPKGKKDEGKSKKEFVQKGKRLIITENISRSSYFIRKGQMSQKMKRKK